MDVRSLLADVAGLGPFFALRAGRGEHRLTDPEPVQERIAHVARALGCAERVAASLAFQGFAAQLVSAPYAAAVLHGEVPAPTPATLWWSRTGDGGWAPSTDAGSTAAADALPALLEDLLGPLADEVRARVPVAARLLWGNAASTVAAAKRLLVVRRPEVAARAAEVAEAVLAHGAFAGAGELLAPRDPDLVWTFRRRTCCLYYRVPGGGLCDDCVRLPPLRSGRPAGP
ncbi:MAG TPA: (2Fe-2S)-binding protein [Pseudonocardia sp.]|uniref:(2Fe-2S)-binding protein n=1 Tax=Pseudonocardia sp. TaxID=60912 RepID=UPI002B4AD166|nr:(2Fe-2S)-binding protein [Pseudonocardia sp.]HLU55113.1 (2Fe-2S)-binding protein [Pseudonocardia sp.]